jgi:hypothetical protein
MQHPDSHSVPALHSPPSMTSILALAKMKGMIKVNKTNYFMFIII